MSADSDEHVPESVAPKTVSERPGVPAGADPNAVRTNRGATTGAVPSSYGAAGRLKDEDPAEQSDAQ